MPSETHTTTDPRSYIRGASLGTRRPVRRWGVCQASPSGECTVAASLRWVRARAVAVTATRFAWSLKEIIASAWRVRRWRTSGASDVSMRLDPKSTMRTRGSKNCRPGPLLSATTRSTSTPSARRPAARFAATRSTPPMGRSGRKRSTSGAASRAGASAGIEELYRRLPGAPVPPPRRFVSRESGHQVAAPCVDRTR